MHDTVPQNLGFKVLELVSSGKRTIDEQVCRLEVRRPFCKLFDGVSSDAISGYQSDLTERVARSSRNLLTCIAKLQRCQKDFMGQNK